MKAIEYKKYGPPDVLQLNEVAKPYPGPDEVLIRVYAATVNRTDCARLRAQPFIMHFTTGLFKPRKSVPGTDFAGRVEAVGKEVKWLKPGDDVFGFDDNGLASQAQYMTFPAHKGIATIPSNLSYEEAAACLEGLHYAYNFINKVTLERGQKVLVNGATGAIGSAAVQLLKYFGARVTAVCSGENDELVRSLGADAVIDYKKRISLKPEKSLTMFLILSAKAHLRSAKLYCGPVGHIFHRNWAGWLKISYLHSRHPSLAAERSNSLSAKSSVLGSSRQAAL